MFLAENESDADYIGRVCGVVSNLFGGYSISHVSGRFRAADIASRVEAAKRLAADERYLIDETTASVRFIVPLQDTREASHTLQNAYFDNSVPIAAIVSEKILQVHEPFFDLFVEAIVEPINGEDEIWLVEEAGGKWTLYVWERA
jgi:hypothetical protein